MLHQLALTVCNIQDVCTDLRKVSAKPKGGNLFHGISAVRPLCPSFTFYPFFEGEVSQLTNLEGGRSRDAREPNRAERLLRNPFPSCYYRLSSIYSLGFTSFSIILYLSRRRGRQKKLRKQNKRIEKDRRKREIAACP